MLHEVQSLTKLGLRISVIFFAGCILWGCSLVDIRPPLSTVKEPPVKQKVFFANYDNVWRATHAAIKYPIAQENQDTGVIETEYIKSADSWQPPESKKNLPSGLRYKLIFTLSKGTTEGRESTRITIEKKIEILKDFFSNPNTLESDGLEEKVLLYRIEREIIINEALKKVY